MDDAKGPSRREARGASHSVPREGAGPVILLVEADPSLSQLYQRALAAVGSVVPTASVDAALCHLTDPVPQVAVVDVAPPGVDGLRLITTLQQQAPQTALMAMTTISPTPTLPGVPVLLKPFPVAELRTLVETLLASRGAEGLAQSYESP